MARAWLIASILWLGATASAATLDGITVVDLGPDDDGAAAAIRGWRRSGVIEYRFLVTYIAANGTYAALVNHQGNDPVCAAWAVEGSYSGDAITFGLPASAPTQNTQPKICQPFTLKAENGRIRASASNPVARRGRSPLASDAPVTRYDAVHDVVARVPLVALDWGAESFRRHNVLGVSLGPLPAVEAALSGRATFTLRESGAPIPDKAFEAPFAANGGQPATRLYGKAIIAETLGWPWDALYLMWHTETFAQPATGEAYEQGALARHGRPSGMQLGLPATQPPLLRYGPDRSPAQGGAVPTIPAIVPTLYWFYDLSGQPLQVGADGDPSNCLATADVWKRASGAGYAGYEVGPWGCSLIVVLAPSTSLGAVRGYRVEVSSPYAIALNHFATRVREMAELRDEIRELQSHVPEF
jgi:hypothetical protein